MSNDYRNIFNKQKFSKKSRFFGDTAKIKSENSFKCIQLSLYCYHFIRSINKKTVTIKFQINKKKKNKES